jgi:hypothetical protein
MKERQAEEEQYAKSAFDGTYSSIVCIGLLEFSDQMEPRGAVAWYGGNERELLGQFWSRLAQDKPSLFITHNGLGFDLPFIRKRSTFIRSNQHDISLAKFRVELCMTRWPSGQWGHAWVGQASTYYAGIECETNRQRIRWRRCGQQGLNSRSTVCKTRMSRMPVIAG